MQVMGRSMTSVPVGETARVDGGLPSIVSTREEETTYSALTAPAPDPWLTVSAWFWLAYFALVAGLLAWLL